jgi:DNA processing protein
VIKRLTKDERRDWLRLARADTVGPVAFRYLIGQYGGPTGALAALPGLAQRGGRLQPTRIPTAAEADAEIAAGHALSARLMYACALDFPPLLAALDPPPPVLWALGDTDLLARGCVAVVGARTASAAGQRFARALAAGLGQGLYVVVSGLARGIDGAAHEGALPTGTIAVLAGGIDSVYPAEHAALYRSVQERGCLVSERPPGFTAQARDFPRRNRLISGLSLGVVVVEAEMRSGSLITARLAGEQGREVFAVPGSPLDPRAKGTNDLLRQGATLCEGPEDVLAVLDSLPGLRAPPAPIFDRSADEEGLSLAVDRVRERVAALLSPTPTPIDEVIRTAAAPSATVLAALMELSLAGRAELLPGGLVVSAQD